MIPKKIYLRNEELEDNYTCERMVSCDVPARGLDVEYTDMSQVWHDASKLPMSGKHILVLHDDGALETWIIPRTFETVLMFSAFGIEKWAYIEDLLPKK